MIKKLKTKELTLKQRLWLKAYLNTDCSETFGNAAAAARAAGYNCKGDYAIKSYAVIGAENQVKLSPLINKWLDENGLSETELMVKLAKGLDVKETKLFHHGGEIIESEPRDCIGEQRRYLDMVIRVKGMYKDNEKPVTVNSINMYAELTREELVQITDAIVAKREKKALEEG